MGITAIILASVAVLSAAHALLVSLEWVAAFGTGFLVLAAAFLLLMVLACREAFRAAKTKNWRHFVPTILILTFFLAFWIFRDILCAFVQNMWQPIGPGGMLPENMIN